MQQEKRVTIRIPVELWRNLRRAQENGKIESIQQAAIDGMAQLIKGNTLSPVAGAIVLGTDVEDREKFATWLEKEGYFVIFGNLEETTLNGKIDPESIEVMRKLWNQFCNS